MDPIARLSLLLSAFLMALIAGLFYSYSVSVNPGLAQLSDTEYLKAMKSINRAILNPWFFLSFMGSVVITPLATGIYYKYAGSDIAFYCLLSASVVYVIGVFGTTIAANVPLNNSLESFDIAGATLDQIKSKRLAFEIPWNRFHTIRTVANVAALILILYALIRKMP